MEHRDPSRSRLPNGRTARLGRVGNELAVPDDARRRTIPEGASRLAEEVPVPFVVLTLVCSVAFGWFIRPGSRALVATGAVALIGLVSMIVTVTDDKGDDPGWLVAVSVVAAVVALAITRAVAARRASAT
jgi:hypothetical protein